MTKFISELHLEAAKQVKMEGIISEYNKATSKLNATETEVLRNKIGRTLISWGFKTSVKILPNNTTIAVRLLAACYAHAE